MGTVWDRAVPGDRASGAFLERTRAVAEGVSRQLGPGAQTVPGGTALSAPEPESFDARLSGTGPYTFAEVYGTPGGGWLAVPSGRTGTATDSLGSTGLAGKVVRVTRSEGGDFRFTFHHLFNQTCPHSYCVTVIDRGTGAPVSGVTVELLAGVLNGGGVLATGTTDADGVWCIEPYPTGSSQVRISLAADPVTGTVPSRTFRLAEAGSCAIDQRYAVCSGRLELTVTGYGGVGVSVVAGDVFMGVTTDTPAPGGRGANYGLDVPMPPVDLGGGVYAATAWWIMPASVTWGAATVGWWVGNQFQATNPGWIGSCGEGAYACDAVWTHSTTVFPVYPTAGAQYVNVWPNCPFTCTDGGGAAGKPVVKQTLYVQFLGVTQSFPMRCGYSAFVDFGPFGDDDGQLIQVTYDGSLGYWVGHSVTAGAYWLCINEPDRPEHHYDGATVILKVEDSTRPGYASLGTSEFNVSYIRSGAEHCPLTWDCLFQTFGDANVVGLKVADTGTGPMYGSRICAPTATTAVVGGDDQAGTRYGHAEVTE